MIKERLLANRLTKNPSSKTERVNFG